ncbi:MAG: secretin N-terminal domain-containing protein [bacterium]
MKNMKKINILKKIIYTFVISFLLIFVLSYQMSSHAFYPLKSKHSKKTPNAVTKQIKPAKKVKELEKNVASGQIKSTEELGDNIFSSSIKTFSQQNKIKEKSADDKMLNLKIGFNAFPETSTIDLVLRDIDVASILRIIAKEGNKNIILDKSVQGTISAELRKVSLNEAMQAILTSEELEARVMDNTIFVASRPAMAKKGLNRKFIKAFKLNNSNAVDIAKILEASIFNKGYIVNEDSAKSSGGDSGSPSGLTMQATADQNQTANNDSTKTITANSSSLASSTGQSSLVNSKIIRGKIETLNEGEGFGEAKRLASEIKTQYVSSTTKDIEVSNNDSGPIVIPDTRTNSVLVAGLREDILLAQETISYLDKPLTQVSIEVSLIELNKEDLDTFKLTLGANTKSFYADNESSTAQFHKLISKVKKIDSSTGESNYISITNSNGLSSIDAGVSASRSNAVSFETIQDLSNNIVAGLQYLIQNHKAKILTNPTILALDGSESLIKITDQIISKMEVTISENLITYKPELADIGIVLNILPKIGDNDYITMKIRPSITTPLKKEYIGNPDMGAFATLISTREVILQDVRVKAGETLAIAGLIKESDISDLSKIPFAADLPVLGKLFRNKEASHKKTELIILITPRIIEDVANNDSV